MLQGTQEFGGVEPTTILVELSLSLQMVEELPTIDFTNNPHGVNRINQTPNEKQRTERHNQIQLIRILEREFKGDDEWIIDQRQDSPLRKDMRDLPWSARDMGFANCFERIHSLRVFLPDLHHFPKTAFPNHLEEIKRLYRKRLIAKLLEVDFKMEGS